MSQRAKRVTRPAPSDPAKWHESEHEDTVPPQDYLCTPLALNLHRWNAFLRDCGLTLSDGRQPLFSLNTLSFGSHHRPELFMRVAPYGAGYECYLAYYAFDLMLPRKAYANARSSVQESSNAPASPRNPRGKVCLLPIKADSGKDAENICAIVQKMCNISPPVVDLLNIKTLHTFVGVARIMVHPDWALRMDPLVVILEKMKKPATNMSEWWISAAIPFDHNISMHQQSHPVSLRLSTIDQAHDAPRPAHQFPFRAVGQEAATAELGRGVVENAIRLMRYVHSKLAGRLMDQTQAEQYTSRLLEPFCGPEQAV